MNAVNSKNHDFYERLNIAAIATLDKDFDIYRRYRNQPFERVFRP